MGNLGFLFKLKNHNLVIFTRSLKFDGNIILGFENLIDIPHCKFLFLSEKLSFEEFIILDDFTYKYSKIKVFNQKIFDFEDFIFYFKPQIYKELRNLFLIEKYSKEILLKKVLEIYNYFN